MDGDLPVFDARALSEERSISLSRQTTAATLLERGNRAGMKLLRKALVSGPKIDRDKEVPA